MPGRMNSCSIGVAVHRLSLISKTTRLRKNGDKTGGFRFIAGKKCAPTILRGGVSAYGRSETFFMCFESIMSRAFIVFMPSPGARGRTRNFFHLICTKCSSELRVARRILFLATMKHSKIANQTNMKAENTCALSSMKQALRASSAKILASYRITYGPICDHSALPDSKSHNGKCMAGQSSLDTNMNGFPLRLTRRTITNRFALCGKKLLNIRQRRRNNHDSTY